MSSFQEITLNRRWLVPVVGLDSAYVSGLATLRAALTGFDVLATDEQVWGITQFAGEELGNQQITDGLTGLGVNASTRFLPADALAGLDQSMPMVMPASTYERPDRYVLIWRQIGSYCQVLDPLDGRRWIHKDQLIQWGNTQQLRLSGDEITKYLADNRFHSYLAAKLRRLHVAEQLIARLDNIDATDWQQRTQK